MRVEKREAGESQHLILRGATEKRHDAQLCSSADLNDRYDTAAGWAPRGLRLQAKAPHGHWKTTTFLAALRNDRIDAPWLFDGPIDGASFRTYVASVLVPALRPGDIVIMDKLSSHKVKAVRQLIRLAGAKLFFLTKYSPDLTPIGFVEAVCAAIGEILGAFTPGECSSRCNGEMRS